MKHSDSSRMRSAEGALPSRAPLIILALLVIIIAIGLVLRRSTRTTNAPDDIAASNPSTKAEPATSRSPRADRVSSARTDANSLPKETAQEIVSRKLAEFTRNRRDLFYRLAKHVNAAVPNEVERFFAALESGRWEEIDAAHTALLEDPKQLNQPRSAEIHQIWRPIQEAWGAAREAHDWPPQTLLDYGSSILDSLRPGMIYAGGTDPGCFIATMLNETSEGERHIVLTQNALADGTYLKYLDFQYGDRMNTLTDDESQNAFKQYTEDAKKRFLHDQQFPDEPKQIKPGEEVKVNENGAVQVSGQIAVMAINERLFKTLMGKNPDASFAMEESFPFSSIYGTAAPLGPVMELGVQDEQKALTAAGAAQSVDYWRTAAQKLLADPDSAPDSDPRKAYSKLISSQAGLLEQQKFLSEAEQAYRLANEVCPISPEAVFRLVNLLLSQNRISDALPVAENAVKAAPDNGQFQGLLKQLKAQTAAPR